MLVPVAVAAVLVVLYLAWLIASFGFDWKHDSARELLDLSTESNVGAWLSGSLLLASAVVAALLARRSTGRDRGGWAVIAGALLACSIDEVGGIHDALNNDLHLNLGTHGSCGTRG